MGHFKFEGRCLVVHLKEAGKKTALPARQERCLYVFLSSHWLEPASGCGIELEAVSRVIEPYF